MRVALAQLPVHNRDIEKNLNGIKEAVRQAADDNSDIILTPEGSLSGYTHDFIFSEVKDALAEITAFAALHNIGLALGTCMEEEDGLRYNEIRFYEANGKYLGCHTKTLLCSFGEDPPEGEINHYATKPLRAYKFKGITIGGLICNDLWANPVCTPMQDPHLAKQLAKMGVKIIFHAVNGGRDESVFSQELVRKFHEVHVLMQADAYRTVICTVDNAYPEHIGVSSIGGVAVSGGLWQHTLPTMGRQMAVVDVIV